MDFKYKDLISYIKKESPFNPELCLILGSGLGDFAENIDMIKSIPTSDIPDYPSSTVTGHKGFLHFAELNGKRVLIFQGRIHIYEGYTIDKCLLPVFIASKLETKKLLVTNAAGGINLNFSPGDLMLITAFYSHNIKSELASFFSLPTAEIRNHLNNLPDKSFNRLIQEAALQENVILKEGTYWFNKGPTYETPAEVRMQGIFGADSVGMSTVHEALYASYHGIAVSSISLITNHAAGLSSERLSHKEVIETAELAKEKFKRLVKRIISKI
ncbi:MAG: purine-nucleoside phosphorylase [Melioribacteraceae bacterium]|nr:purine-nucleoside phosphorylase [Melioribacteraceae bacterium]